MLPAIERHEKLLASAAGGGQLDLVAALSAEDVMLRSRREYAEVRLAHHKAWLALERAAGGRAYDAGAARTNERGPPVVRIDDAAHAARHQERDQPMKTIAIAMGVLLGACSNSPGGNSGGGAPSGDVVVNEIYPHGVSMTDPNLLSDYAEIKNKGKSAVDLTSYKVRDSSLSTCSASPTAP